LANIAGEESGRFKRAGELVAASSTKLEWSERVFESKLANLRTAIDEGDASGIADGDVFAQIRATLKIGSR
jgi:hypothetical protein